MYIRPGDETIMMVTAKIASQLIPHFLFVVAGGINSWWIWSQLLFLDRFCFLFYSWCNPKEAIKKKRRDQAVTKILTSSSKFSGSYVLTLQTMKWDPENVDRRGDEEDERYVGLIIVYLYFIHDEPNDLSLLRNPDPQLHLFSSCGRFHQKFKLKKERPAWIK